MLHAHALRQYVASRSIRGLLTVSLAFILVAISSRADIAPTQFVGYGISTVQAKGLRMVSAKVDITWGTPCTLTATFVINNQTLQPIEVQLGFPITNVYLERAGKLPNDVSFMFNDGTSAVKATRVGEDPLVRKLNSIVIDKVDFRGVDIADVIPVLTENSRKFDPEHKGVHFELRLPPSTDGDNFAKGSVGRRIGIEWENCSLAELLDRMIGLSNLQYSMEGEMVYFEPRTRHPGADFAWYRSPYAFPPGPTKVSVVTKLPASLMKGMAYCERLNYCIQTGGSWDGTIGSEEIAIHFPSPVTSSQIIEARPAGYNIDGNTVRWMFNDFKPKDWDHDIEIGYLRPDVVAVLAKARADLAREPANSTLALNLAKDLFVLGRGMKYHGHPPDDGSLYTDEASGLVEKVLQNHPSNAQAWNISFNNYDLIHNTGHWLGGGTATIGPDEIAQIKKAIALCPQDKCLKLWYQVMTHSPYAHYDYYGNPDLVALHHQMEVDGNSNEDYPKINYGYY